MRQIETVVQTPLRIQMSILTETDHETDQLNNDPRNVVKRTLNAWINRGLEPDRHIELRIGWPLLLIPLVMLNQLVSPHPVWVVLLVTLCGLYGLSYFWVRRQAPAISLTRRRIGSILVAGDLLQEEFELTNRSQLPVVWAEFIDESTLPNYAVGRVVACSGEGFYRWRAEVECKQRGLFQLGPHRLRLQDPFGIFVVTIVNRAVDAVVIYPRVVHLPPLQLPRGNAQGSDRQRRPLLGSLPASTVAEYRHGDSLRYVHWPSSARRGQMMVKELEAEPSGNIWLVLNLERKVQQGDGSSGTLEHGIVITASLAADLLSGSETRAVGLLAFGSEIQEDGLVEVLPGVGNAHLWPILTALAPVTAGELGLAELLASSRTRIGRRSTLTVITPVVELATQQHGDLSEDGAPEIEVDWVAELIHLKRVGVASSVILVQSADADPTAGDAIQSLLVRMNIPCSLVVAGTPLSSLLTFRRRRRVVRTTPTGGVVSYEVDEEVG